MKVIVAGGSIGGLGAGLVLLCHQHEVQVFEKTDESLRERGLAPAQWQAPTIAGQWTVHDVAAHLLDTGRELTERWLHHQQIRQAVGARDLFDAWIYRPILDIFLRGLPHLYRDVTSPEGTALVLTVSDVADASWQLVRPADRWQLVQERPAQVTTEVTVAPDAAWRWLSKAWKQPEIIRPHLQVSGDVSLAEPLMRYAAVMA